MDMFSALGEPNRRTIVELIARRGELTASEISDKFSISPQAISQHLKILREAKILKMEKQAQSRIYSINPSAMRSLEEWVKKMTQIWDTRFAALDKVLENEKKKIKKGGR